MSRIIDLTATTERPEILTSRSVNDRLLGSGQILADEPLERGLDEHEEPMYILRNKKSGFEIKRDSETDRFEPDSHHQAVCLITDLRVVFAAGRESGDERAELALSQIVQARETRGRLRTNALALETLAGERWRFACKGELSEIAAWIDEMAHVWANALRLLEEVEQQVATAQPAADDDAFEAARERLGDAEGKLRTAHERISEVGPGAVAAFESRASPVAEQLLDLIRVLAADEGASAHAAAQHAWSERAYESAAAEYERAISSYERALSMRGANPDDEALGRRLVGALRERELLRVGPLVDAEAALGRAHTETDPELAARAWEEALDGYRELLSLDWGKESREFVGDRDEIRETTVSVADDAISAHLNAGTQWIQSGDRLALAGHDMQAQEVYERAHDRFEQAAALAREVHPERLDRAEQALAVADSRRSGEPPEAADEPVPETVVITGEDATDAGPGTDDGGTVDARTTDAPVSDEPPELPERSEQLMAGADAPSDDDVAEDDGDSAEREAAGPEPALESAEDRSDGEHDEERSSVLDQIRAQKRTSQGDEHTPDSRNSPARPESVDGLTGPDSFSGDDSDGAGERARDEIGEDDTGGADETLVDALVALSSEQFDEVVAALWRARGWSVTVLSTGNSAAYDVVATREEPPARVGIWTAHQPDGDLETSVVKTCAETRGDDETDSAVLVTSARPTTAARALAERADLTVVETDTLVAHLREEGCEARVYTFVGGT